MSSIDTKVLRRAGLELMRKNGRPLTKKFGISQIYEMKNGTDIQTVRLKTHNDQILMIKSDNPYPDANLSIEGTDWILLVMPRKKRSEGSIIGHLIPTSEVVDRARRSHAAWLEADPNTNGETCTWKLEFNECGPGKYSGTMHEKVGWGLFEKWSNYCLSGEVSSYDHQTY